MSRKVIGELFLIASLLSATSAFGDAAWVEAPPLAPGLTRYPVGPNPVFRVPENRHLAPNAVISPDTPVRSRPDTGMDWHRADPSKRDPEFPIDIPLVLNGNVPINRASEHHQTLQRHLGYVEDALYEYYDLRQRGMPSSALGSQKQITLDMIGRMVTVMDGYARIYHEDISAYMADLQRIVKRFY